MIQNHAVARDFFLRDLLDKMDSQDSYDITLEHPFACGEIRGQDGVSAALERLSEPLSSLQGGREYYQPGLAAKSWDAELHGRSIRGVTTLSLSGTGVESAIMLSSFPSASLWREQVMRASADTMPQEEWELPEVAGSPEPPAIRESELDPKLPFPIAEDMVFHSPILSRPVHGPELISRVFAHTSAIYGERKHGPKIPAGRNVMSFWEGSVSGFTIKVANEIRFNEKREVDEMVMSMRPWPVVKLFRERCLVLTRHFLDISYFES